MRGAETREALLDAALEVFAAQGYHGASVPEVASRAGVGAATMYRHFEGKEALVNAVYLHAKRRFAALLWDGFDPDQPVRRAFHDVWARLARVARREAALVVFLDFHHHAPYLTAETVAAAERIGLAPVEALLRRGQEEGVVRREDPRLVIAFLSGAFVGVLKLALAPGGLDEALLARAEALAWAAVRA